jgi:hypothetical protein
MLGAAEALREVIGAPLSPSERIVYDYDHHVAIVCTTLGRESFTSLWADGRAMTLEQAIEYALTTDR